MDQSFVQQLDTSDILNCCMICCSCEITSICGSCDCNINICFDCSMRMTKCPMCRNNSTWIHNPYYNIVRRQAVAIYRYYNKENIDDDNITKLKMAINQSYGYDLGRQRRIASNTKQYRVGDGVNGFLKRIKYIKILDALNCTFINLVNNYTNTCEWWNNLCELYHIYDNIFDFHYKLCGGTNITPLMSRWKNHGIKLLCDVFIRDISINSILIDAMDRQQKKAIFLIMKLVFNAKYHYKEHIKTALCNRYTLSTPHDKQRIKNILVALNIFGTFDNKDEIYDNMTITTITHSNSILSSLPKQFSQTCDKYYHDKLNGMGKTQKLNWVGNMGSAVIEIDFGDDVVEFVVSTIQMIILSNMSGIDTITLDTLMESTHLTKTQLNVECGLLVKHGILVQHHDQGYSINQNYDNQPVNLLLSCEHDRYVQYQNVAMSINERNIIQGKIIKVIMIRREMDKSGLINVVMCELGDRIRSITYENIKECITTLIEQEYITCNSDGVIRYLV